MDYQQSRAYIEDAQRYGSVLGLANMREMMKRLGNPQDRLSYVHVAGTNGKGSVIAYLYSILSQAGYKVGRYISPALYSYRERMETAKVPVSREKFAEYLTQVAQVIETMTKEGLPHPTPFEIETAVAFLFFAEEKCDLVLLEVGMGGDMDATNIIPAPKAAVLASISMDHLSFLGNTLGEIAEKKAGIIKKGCEMVTTLQQPEAEAAIRKKCAEEGVSYHQSSPEQAEVLEEGVLGQRFFYKGETYQIPLAGVYQVENAVLALEVLKILGQQGYPVTVAQQKAGLLKTQWGGRFTVIHENPLMVVDGAHNAAAADMLAESIRHYFPEKKLYFIMGTFQDKDYRSIIKKTCPYAQKVLTIETPDNPRALPAEMLAEEVRKVQPAVTAMNSLKEAVDKAFAMAGKEDVILAFGSLSFIGALTEIVENKKDEEETDDRLTRMQRKD